MTRKCSIICILFLLLGIAETDGQTSPGKPPPKPDSQARGTADDGQIASGMIKIVPTGASANELKNGANASATAFATATASFSAILATQTATQPASSPAKTASPASIIATSTLSAGSGALVLPTDAASGTATLSSAISASQAPDIASGVATGSSQGIASESGSSSGEPAAADASASESDEIVTEGASDETAVETGEGGAVRDFGEKNYLGLGEPKKELGPVLTPPKIKGYGKLLAEAGTGNLIAMKELQGHFWPTRIPELNTKFEEIKAKDLTKLYLNPGWLDQRKDDASSIVIFLSNPYSVQFKIWEGELKIFDFINVLEEAPMGKPTK